MQRKDFKPGVKFTSVATGNVFEVLKIERALLADSYNVTIRNCTNGRKSVHGIGYLERLELHVVEG